MIGLKDVSKLLPAVLCGEWYEASVATESRGHAAGVIVIGGHDTAGRLLLDVTMCLDAAGQYVFAGGIDYSRCVIETPSDRDDTAVADADIGGKAVGRIGNRAAANYQVVVLHHLILNASNGAAVAADDTASYVAGRLADQERRDRAELLDPAIASRRYRRI